MRQDSVSLTRHLTVCRDGGHIVLALRGEIDISTATEIGPYLDRETGRPGALVVIDLGGVEFFDCSGLRLLYRARRRVLDRGGRVALVCAHPMTLRMLRITGLTRLLPPLPTRRDALDALGTEDGRPTR
ncbi:anti-sigma factor antagonist [Streptomyces sp. NPDC052077]|uniref:anti-sigma factor antagonist n=1 Tax=Streptomyces sp. NPDC052077 TaxID=3154757 RepID=UPI003440738A